VRWIRITKGNLQIAAANLLNICTVKTFQYNDRKAAFWPLLIIFTKGWRHHRFSMVNQSIWTLLWPLTPVQHYNRN